MAERRVASGGEDRAESGSGRTASARPDRRWVLPIAAVILGVAALIVWQLAAPAGDEAGDPAGEAPAAEGAPADGAAGEVASSAVTPSGPDEQGRAARLLPRVLAEHPHDATAFTQGLELHEGQLYESTGLRGRSSLRQVDLATGNITRAERLDDSFFGEGLTIVEDSIWQLTWQSGVAIHYDLEGLGRIGIARYEGEGWGLCHDGERLVMSDGSGSLFFRDPETFTLEDEIAVTLDGGPVERLNELECVGPLVYANVWQTNDILEIDSGTGVVSAVIDATALTMRAMELATTNMDVLNGIAFDPPDGNFLVTGKLWPVLFEVDFEPAPAGGEGTGE